MHWPTKLVTSTWDKKVLKINLTNCYKNASSIIPV